MKRILYIMLCTGLFTGCSEDFTDLAPISNRNEADFYKSADDFEVAINASYRGLQSTGIYGRGYWTMFEMRSDNTDQGLMQRVLHDSIPKSMLLPRMP